MVQINKIRDTTIVACILLALPSFMHALPLPDGEQTTLPALVYQNVTDTQQDVSRDTEEEKSYGPTFTTPEMKLYPENDSTSEQTSSENEPSENTTSEPGSGDILMISHAADDRSTSAPAFTATEEGFTGNSQPLDGEVTHEEDDKQLETKSDLEEGVTQPYDSETLEEDQQAEKDKQISNCKQGETTPQTESISTTSEPRTIAPESSQIADSLRNSAFCKWTWEMDYDELRYEQLIKIAVCDRNCTRCTETFGNDYSCQQEMRKIFSLRHHKTISGNMISYTPFEPSFDIIPVACVCAKNT